MVARDGGYSHLQCEAFRVESKESSDVGGFGIGSTVSTFIQRDRWVKWTVAYKDRGNQKMICSGQESSSIASDSR